VLADLDPIAFVPVNDLDRARAFYEGVLGLTVDHADSFALVLGHGTTTVRVVAVGQLTPQPFTILGWDAPDIDATVESLAAKGVTFLRYDGFEQDALGIWTVPGGGGRVAWFHDPDGNVLSVSSHAPPPG
jgi:catechol 2,3-dioxygenase-like lactoylglutathione lyase family enzyme